VPPTGGSSTAEPRTRFLFDLASPACWLVAERIRAMLPATTEWVPVHVPDLGEGEGFRCAEEEQIWRAAIERRAAQLGLPPVHWPARVPFDSGLAMRAATYADDPAFALAAFRQAWCAGRSLDEPDAVAQAAAACGLDPAALLRGAGLPATHDALARAGAGVEDVPAIVLPSGRILTGDDAPEQAASSA
jgi:2-hydroxychromene-2-carboxylate isomerase